MLGGVHHRVLEEAAGVADLGRVGQLAATDRDHRVGDVERGGRADAARLQLARHVRIARDRLPRPRQAKAHRGDQPLPRLALEHAVAVAERTVVRTEAAAGAGVEIDRVERVETIDDLQPVGADVLDRRRAHRARDQRQVLQPRPALGQRPAHEVVPVLAGAGLDDPGLGLGAQQASAGQVDLEHDAGEVAGEHHVAAAAEHQARRARPVGLIDQRACLVGVAHMHQPRRARPQAEGVEAGELRPANIRCRVHVSARHAVRHRPARPSSGPRRAQAPAGSETRGRSPC